MSTVTVSEVTNNLLPQEFERFFRENYQFVYRTAYRVTRSAEDAEDILQTIFLRVLGRRFSLDLQQSPRAYLYRAAVNMSLDVIRSRKNYSHTADVEQIEAAVRNPDTTSEEELHRRLYEAIAELKPAAAEILLLRYVHNYSDSDIAKLLGKSRGVIAINLFRSRARLKKLITASLGEKL